MIDERQRTRLGMLAVASVLMGGGVYGWMWWNGQKAAEAEMNASVPTAAVRLRTPKINSDGQTEANALSQSAGENAGGSKPVNTAATVPVQPGSATTNGAAPATATATGATPTASTPATRIAVSSQNVITAKVGTAATAPAIKPANSLASNNAAINTAFKPAVNSAPPASITAGIRPPVTPANGAPLRPVQVATAVGAPVTAIAVRPAAPVAPENPAAASVPAPAGAMKAITTLEASAVAKLGMGRKDPMQPIAALLPFPRVSQTGGNNNLVPPPPNDTAAAAAPKSINAVPIASKIKEKLVPPPPPTESNYPGGDALGGLPIEQLPVPPSKPMIGDKLRVVCVMDDKAIVSFPTDVRAKNKWPKTITLAKGEQFDSIRVVGISPDGVTIEEDGERTLRPVSHIK